MGSISWPLILLGASFFCNFFLQIFRLLAATAQKLEEEDKNRHIIIDADLIWLYFKLEPKLALTAITMALAHA